MGIEEQDVTDPASCLFVKQRLSTFGDNWPFKSNTTCTPLKMAEAGFLCLGIETEPDLAQCYVCLKKLDGWEKDDDPLEEHKKHAKDCLFVKLDKKESELTVGEHLDLSLERSNNLMKAQHAEYREMLVETSKQTKKLILKLKKLKK